MKERCFIRPRWFCFGWTPSIQFILFCPTLIWREDLFCAKTGFVICYLIRSRKHQNHFFMTQFKSKSCYNFTSYVKHVINPWLAETSFYDFQIGRYHIKIQSSNGPKTLDIIIPFTAICNTIILNVEQIFFSLERFSVSNDPHDGSAAVGGSLLGPDVVVFGSPNVEEWFYVEVLSQAHRSVGFRQVCLLRVGSHQHLEGAGLLRSHRQGLHATLHSYFVQVLSHWHLCRGPNWPFYLSM